MNRIRKIGLFVVMLGALSLSFHGQVDAVTPLLGTVMGVVFALTFDLATLLALNEVMGAARRSPVRRWSWAALLLAGSTALTLNTWSALLTGHLPDPFAILIGAGPVALAWVLSHLVALAVAADTDTATDTSATADTAAVARPGSATADSATDTRQVAVARPAGWPVAPRVAAATATATPAVAPDGGATDTATSSDDTSTSATATGSAPDAGSATATPAATHTTTARGSARVTPIDQHRHRRSRATPKERMRDTFERYRDEGRLNELTGALLARDAGTNPSLGRRYLAEWRREVAAATDTSATADTGTDN